MAGYLGLQTFGFHWGPASLAARAPRFQCLALIIHRLRRRPRRGRQSTDIHDAVATFVAVKSRPDINTTARADQEVRRLSPKSVTLKPARISHGESDCAVWIRGRQCTMIAAERALAGTYRPG